MRFLFLQSKGLHPENCEFKEGLQRALVRQHHEVDTYGPGHALFKQPFPTLARERRWPVIIIAEDYKGAWVPNVWGLRALRIFWSMDSHLALPQHVAVCKKQKVQIVLTAVYDSVSSFRWKGCEAHWFPNAYPADLIGPRPDVKKQHYLGFCGNWANRRKWIDSINERVGINTDIGVIGEAMVEAINSYKIHFNRNVSYDINARTTETLGCGTMLLTNQTPGLDQIFKIGTHLVCYEGMDDCCDKAWHYIEHKLQREAIAKAGHEHVLAQHTYDRRAEQLMEIIKGRA